MLGTCTTIAKKSKLIRGIEGLPHHFEDEKKFGSKTEIELYKKKKKTEKLLITTQETSFKTLYEKSQQSNKIDEFLMATFNRMKFNEVLKQARVDRFLFFFY